MFTRRDFIKGVSLATPAFLLRQRLGAEDISSLSEAFVPIRKLTSGPKFHWFGYYDKLELDATDRFVLCNEVDFEGRSPTADDRIKVGMVDLEDGDNWIELGTSNAWSWQQGCMLQWRPGKKREVIWNDRMDGAFVSRIKDVDTGSERILPRPIYALSADGKWAVTLDFGRLQNMRPGYGYPGIEDPYADQVAPADSGIWRMDLQTGESKLIIPLAELARIPFNEPVEPGRRHWVNHLLISPDSKRLVFLNRHWVKSRTDPSSSGKNWFVTRMLTANLDGGDLNVIDPSGHTSHFIWRDGEHICAWTRPEGCEAGFYLLRDHTNEFKQVGEGIMTTNGHNTYLPLGNGQDWILNDTYPKGPQRHQIPYVYHVPTRTKTELGHFHSPEAYQGEWRCDTHPRFSRDGTRVFIDSPHGGDGRQLWMLDISGIVRGQ